MTQSYFVTGTDTGIGKTYISLALIKYLQQQGQTVLGMKPVASGCERLEEGLRNEDALLLQAAASIKIAYESINPYAFELAVSPHIAAAQAGEEIKIQTIVKQYKDLSAMTDTVIVEGVGGWLVPLNQEQTVADLAVQLNLPVIVVVGMRLGCINQARLTFESIRQRGVTCKGWVANCIDPDMQALNENIETIQQGANMPLLATFPYASKGGNPLFNEEFSL